MNVSKAKINNVIYSIIDYKITIGFGINISTIYIIANEQINSESPSSLGYIEILDSSDVIIDKGYVYTKKIVEQKNIYIYMIKYKPLITLLDKTITEKYDNKTLNYIINHLYLRYIEPEGFTSDINYIDDITTYNIVFNKNNLLQILYSFTDYFQYIFYIDNSEVFTFKPRVWLASDNFNYNIIHDVSLDDNSINVLTNLRFLEYSKLDSEVNDNELQNMGYSSNYYFSSFPIYDIIELREGYDNTPVSTAVYNDTTRTDPSIVFFYNRLQKRIWKNPLSSYPTELDMTINVDYIPIKVVDESYSRVENEDYVSENRSRLGSGEIEKVYRGRQFKTQQEINDIYTRILETNEISFKTIRFKSAENIYPFKRILFNYKDYLDKTIRPYKYIIRQTLNKNYYEYELSERYGSNGIDNIFINQLEYSTLDNI